MADAPPQRAAAARRGLGGRVSAVALVVVLAVALAFGSGLGRGGTASLSSRAASLEAGIRCPSCEDVSVAASQASSAVAARDQIARMLRAGESDAEIERSFVERYGPSILLVPPPSGLGALVWVLPLAGASLALGLLAALFWRRQRALVALRAGGS